MNNVVLADGTFIQTPGTAFKTVLREAYLQSLHINSKVDWRGKLRGRRIVLAFALTFCSSSAFATIALQQLQSNATKAAHAVRGFADFKNPGCYLDALFNANVIVRSNDRRLFPGDTVTSINGMAVDETLKVGDQFRAIPSNSTVTLAMRRLERPISVSLRCKSRQGPYAAELRVYDAAAMGDLEQCIGGADQFAKTYIQSSGMYWYWRVCSIAAGRLSEIERWSTLVEYWSLELQQLRFNPAALERSRSHYLSALTAIENAGQRVLADELRNQWTIASGEPPTKPTQRIASGAPPVAQTPPAALLRATSPRTRRARSGSDCEDGHWIDSVMDDGSIVKLEDGSIWKVDDIDTVDSALWLPTTDIVVCDGKLINTEDNESVEAEKIR